MGKALQQVDPSSLRVRLTVGVAAVSAVGLGGVAFWTSWKMQQILVATHKQTVEYIADRFPTDVEIYSDMMSLESGVPRAIANLTNVNTLLWVRHPDGRVGARSLRLSAGAEATPLLSLPQKPFPPQVQLLNGRYWVLCATPLQVEGENLGMLYVAQDITNDQVMFFSLVRTLGFASLLAIAGMTIAIAIYIQRSLQPLQRMSQLTENISAEDLGEARIHLDNPPSEVRELVQTFDKMLVRLFEAWEQQRQFVSNVSHELRTPLTIVSGYLQSTLRRGDNLREPQREALEIAASEAERTIHLLKDLLDLARADSGHRHFQLEPVVLNDLVEEVASMARQYSDRVINVASTIPTLSSVSQIITAKADAHRLKQVLLNLIDNAVKYSHPDHPVTLNLKEQGEWAMIQVCDQGTGIPLPQQTRIFERFYRVDETRARSTGGTGLGLSIVKTLVEGMGGTVSVRSQLGEGSTFTVTLPNAESK